MKHSQHLFTSLPFSSFHLLWQRPTLPNPYVGKARQKALVFLHLDYLFGETNG